MTNQKIDWLGGLASWTATMGVICTGLGICLLVVRPAPHKLESLWESPVEAIHKNPEGLVTQYGSEGNRHFEVIPWSNVYYDSRAKVARIARVWPHAGDFGQKSLILPTTSTYIDGNTLSLESLKQAKEAEENGPASQQRSRTTGVIFLVFGLVCLIASIVSYAMYRKAIARSSVIVQA